MNTITQLPRQKTAARFTSAALTLGFIALLSACGGGSAAPDAATTNQPAAATPTEVSPQGDVPDNAVFVDYTSQDGGYTVQYVEGWAVQPGTNGDVSITDIDSAELVAVQELPSGDLTQYVSSTDEAQLQAQTQDYQRTDLKTVTVNGQSVVELDYSATSAPDAVTNKTRSIVGQRYYIPSPSNKLAILTLITPDGVDNVDAFRQILESFTWQA